MHTAQGNFSTAAKSLSMVIGYWKKSRTRFPLPFEGLELKANGPSREDKGRDDYDIGLW